MSEPFPNPLVGPDLITECLVLRLWSQEELDAVRWGRRLPTFCQDFPAPGDVEIAELIAALGTREDVFGHRLLVERSSELVVGSAALLVTVGHDDIEVGFGVVPSRRGRGYASEAVTALLRLGLGAPGVRSIVAGAEEDNIASLRVLDRAGFRRTHNEGSLVRFVAAHHADCHVE